MTSRSLPILLALSLSAAGCVRNSDDIDGPTPSLLQVVPEIMCVEQSDRELRLEGDGLAPLLLGAATDDVSVRLPQAYLLRVRDLEGGFVARTEEIAVAPEDARWESQRAMTLLVRSSLGLEPGVYQLRVENGSGKEAVLADAFSVVPPPVITEIAPDGFGQRMSGDAFGHRVDIGNAVMIIQQDDPGGHPSHGLIDQRAGYGGVGVFFHAEMVFDGLGYRGDGTQDVGKLCLGPGRRRDQQPPDNHSGIAVDGRRGTGG